MSAIELMPCPFCGGDPIINHGATDDFNVMCCNRGCFGPSTSGYAFESDAIAAWNRRAETRQELPAGKLDGNEIWEWLFGTLKGDVPDAITDDLLNELALWINTVFTTPAPLPAGTVTEEMVERATDELLAHGEFSTIPAQNRPNAKIAARATLEAAFAVRPAEPVAVKGLRWEQPDGHGETHSWLGHGTDYCQYYIRWDSNGAWVMPGDADEPDAYATIDEAKAAAQADYEARIRSALIPTPAPGLVEALRRIIEAHDTNTGNEPSISVFERAIDEGRAALASITETGGAE